MNELLKTMATDMAIPRYGNESDNSYFYRLVYSALGLWCLKTAQSQNKDERGATKVFLTKTLNKLLDNFCELFPQIKDSFFDETGESISKFIRIVYEETGYLLESLNNKNIVAIYGRGVDFGANTLYFGLPDRIKFMTGLGVYSDSAKYYDDIKNVLIRDSLTLAQFIDTNFDPIMFSKWDKDGEYEYFNPLKEKAPISAAWENRPQTGFTIARTKAASIADYYRVIVLNNGETFYKAETQELSSDKLTDKDYRRLYFALKAYYKSPYKIKAKHLDNTYSVLSIFSRLPNREQYLLLLAAWPDCSSFERNKYIIRKESLPQITNALKNLWIEVEEQYA